MPSIDTIIQTVITAIVTRTAQQLIGYRTDSRAWRGEMMHRVNPINEATQATAQEGE